MKKILIVLVLITVLLAACGGSGEDASAGNGAAQAAGAENTAQTAQGDQTANGQPPDFSQMELPLMSQLMIGTFMLEDTEYAVDAAQAAELLPLWQVLNNILNSDTAADQEINAVVDQIEKTMTAEQLQAIADMELTNQSIGTLMQDLGLDLRRPDNADDSSNGGFQGGFPDGFQPGEGFPGGAPPDGGGGGFGPGGGNGTGLSEEEIASLQATREAGGGFDGPMGGANRMSTMLLDPLIQLLEGKIS